MPDGQPKIGGCQRGPESAKDFRMLAASGRTLPDKVNLRRWCSPVENQRQLNSCTANAAVGALEILERKQGIPQADLSRLFVYYNTRVLDGNVDSDIGAYISNSMKAIKLHGACLESMWRYDIGKVFARPGRECYKDGLIRQAMEYARVAQGHGVRAALADGLPVVFGMMLHESFNRTAGGKGIVPMPADGEMALGGHAMLIVGYDTEARMYLVRNSWGEQWGNRGYCRIPFAMVDNPRMSWDFWIVRAIEEPEVGYEVERPSRDGQRRQLIDWMKRLPSRLAGMLCGVGKLN